jgi:GNAT superfamily N-acetyltransferase
MLQTITVRRAMAADAATIANHRVGMFRDMGVLAPDLEPQLHVATEVYLRDAMPRGEYVGWLASVSDREDDIVAGAGVQIRRILPRPMDAENRIAIGLEGLVLNVFTEKEWRRQGIAERLMREVLAWAATSEIDKLVLHAAEDGRNLYERLGFVQTNEMRYNKPLHGNPMGSPHK